MKLYVNGVRECEKSYAPAPTGVQMYVIGGEYDFTNYRTNSMNGSMSNTTWYKFGLKEEEVQNIFDTLPAETFISPQEMKLPVILDLDFGKSIIDSSENNLEIVTHGEIPIEENTFFNGAHFEKDEYLEIKETGYIALPDNNMSVFAWIKDGGGYIVKNKAVSLLRDGAGHIICEIDGQRLVSGKTINLLSWAYAGCTYDGQTLKVYINGQKDGELAIEKTIQDIPLYIKVSNGGFLGLISNVKILNRIVDETEIVNQFNEYAKKAQPLRELLEAEFKSNLMAYYSFDEIVQGIISMVRI